LKEDLTVASLGPDLLRASLFGSRDPRSAVKQLVIVFLSMDSCSLFEWIAAVSPFPALISSFQLTTSLFN
jgi:hypothetical protein